MLTADIETEVAALARRYRELGEVLADLAAQRSELKSRFEALVCVGYEATVDGVPVYKRAPNRAFDLALAERIARTEAIPITRVTVIDVDDLKARLKAAGHLDRAMSSGTGANRVQL